MQTILYARVSKVDQTLEHQRTQAEAKGFKIDHLVADHGVSDVSTNLMERPEGRRLMDMLRKEHAGGEVGGPPWAGLSRRYGHHPAVHALVGS